MGKYHHLLRGALVRIHAGSFGELDILALLILAREHAARDSAIRELGDFTAHRERDRGPFTDYVMQQKNDLASGTAGTGPPLQPADFTDGLLNESPVFTVASLASELDDLSRRAGLADLPPERSEVVAMMVISLLQGVRFLERQGKSNVVVGRVMVGLTHHYIAAVAVFELPGNAYHLPLLAVPNNWYTVPVAQPEFLGFVPDEEMEVECANGTPAVRFL